MTREEIIMLLKYIRNQYPEKKNINAKEMVDSWEAEFSSYPADVIYKAARHHINTSVYFPKIPDIKKSINKGQMLYGEDQIEQQPVIEPPQAPKKLIPVTVTFCDMCGLCDIKDQDKCPCDI